MNRRCQGVKRACFGVSRVAGLGLLLAGATSHAAAAENTDRAIHWLPLTQTSPPPQIAGLRRDILGFIDPLRRQLFGDPKTIRTTAYFISVLPANASGNVFPSATSTNADGTRACVLSAAQFSSYHKHLLTTEGVDEFAAPGVQTYENAQAVLSVTEAATIAGTNAAYGQKVDLVHSVDGTNLDVRVIAEVTQLVTNAVPATGPASESVSVRIRTVFQSALEASVPSGGALAIWTKPTGGNEKIYLLLIRPSIQTNSPSPRPSVPRGTGQAGAQGP